MIPLNVIFPWQGNHADIPSGWSRETTLDDKYPKSYGDSVVPNTTGGNSTHTHTSTAHSHAVAAHTHTYSLSLTSPTLSGSSDGTLSDNHTHTGTSGALSGGTTETTAVTYGAFSNDPPYYTVIYIKSANGQIPDNLIAYFNDTTAPTNWYFCDGNNSTPDLRNKYLKGAGTGANAGTTGGTTTNAHSINHTHTTNAHTHVAANSGTASGGTTREGSFGDAIFCPTSHTHSVTMAASTQAINSNSDNKGALETVEPAYHKLLPIQKKTGGGKSKGIIGLWLGSTTTIPAGWFLCNGDNGTPDLRDKFIKCANTTAEIGNTGGSNTHTHAAEAHSHTGSGTHTHVGTAANNTAFARRSSEPEDSYAIKVHTHTVEDEQNVTANTADANTTADSSNNEPEYRTAAYIEFQYEVGGSFLFNLI